MVNIWKTTDADDILRANWGTAAAPEIADMINAAIPGAALTRCAIIGRANRIGLDKLAPSGRRMGTRNAMPIIPRKRVRNRRPNTFMRNVGPPMAPMPLPEPDFTDAPPEKRLTVEQLERDTCRMVLGDVGIPGWGFCPEKQWADSSYCRSHHIRCHQIPR